MKTRITTEFIMAYDPCGSYPESKVKKLIGPRGKTLLQILSLDIPAEDRIWVLTRPDVLTHCELVKFAIECAKRVLPNFEEKYPKDKRPRKAIESAEKWLINPSKKNASAAYAAAYTAYAAYATYAAAYAAANAAANAANAAERTAQIADLRAIVKARSKR